VEGCCYVNKGSEHSMTDLCRGHGLGLHTTLSYDDSILTKNLQNCA